MTAAPPRDLETRKADALAMLTTPAVDAWVATASREGTPYLVPLSMAWVDERVVIAVHGSSPTARNLAASEVVRIGVGPTRDVVLIDAVVERDADVAADDGLASAYAAQADWDPRGSSGYAFFVLRPKQIQAWREANELEGRVLMRDGVWLV